MTKETLIILPRPEEFKLNSEFNVLVDNLRASMEKGMVSFVDSDAVRLASYLKDHPEFEPELLSERQKILNDIVVIAWRAPGWEESIDRLKNPRLEIDNFKSQF